jgi:hypothetical protein
MPQSQSVAFATAPELDPAQSGTAEILKELSKPLQVHSGEYTPPRTAVRDVLIAVATALALRIPYFRGRMFPLNDGGMFAQIIDDIRAAHFALPTHTTYNLLDIPLSYPPLAFYLGALCTLFTGQNAVSVLVWLPLLLNLITVVMVYLIAKEIYPSGFYACLAACCFASIGRGAEWLTMGGGLTRGLGMLCATVAILLFLRSRKHNSLTLAAWSGVWVGLAIASHLEGGIFAAFSLVVLSVLLEKRWQNIRLVALAGAVSIVVVLPWMIWLYRHLGFGPLMNAGPTGGSYYLPRNVTILGFLVASVIFAVVARFPYVCWLAVIPLVMRRSGPTYGAAVGGLCMVWFANAIVVLLARRGVRLRRWRTTIVVVLAIAFSLQFSGMPRIRRDRLADLRSNSRAQVSPAGLAGMQAAGRLTPINAKFFVFNQRFGNWPTDMVAEWFPYFAKRQCVNTVQGREWLPNNAFFHAIELGEEVELSGSQHVTATILEELKPDYIFIAGPFNPNAGPFDENQAWLANTLRLYAGSSPIYENSEVAIYKVERTQLTASSTSSLQRHDQNQRN